MPSSTLQGLNIVHPAQEGTDSHDLLLGQAYPDLTAQLDLWTNLAFESEEPLNARPDDLKASRQIADEEEEARSPTAPEKGVHDGHVNLNPPMPNAFDINTFLAGFAMDQQFAAHHALPPQQQPGGMAPSLAQILALHSNQTPAFAPGFPAYPAAPPATFARPAPSPAVEETYVPAKRARARKESVTSVGSPDYREESAPPPTTLSAAEDKRRRNTAASARFRLKKKEREAALEGRAKELEAKVNELERECEGLRRENGWLKGLVVGVTGAAQAPSANHTITVAPSPPPVSAGTKRRREDAQTA
ncbi:hypothetical protein D9613_000312 [Agrocybe pediades]|uniref:BZIP domain-containing protein n=1 Tax=Agrocybe pediades TaxID=84607 RepID=A0A8H4VS31_9AGAR|nr:hypothetical protein D9613_000312 [Agrocybe pediades]